MKKELSTKEDTLKSLIESAGYTQKKFAQEVKLNLSAITAYIAGVKVPRTDRFLEMCRKLNVSPKTLAKSMGMDVSDIPDD